MSVNMAHRAALDLDSLALGIWAAFTERNSGEEASAQARVEGIKTRLNELERSENLLHLRRYFGDGADVAYLRGMTDHFSGKTMSYAAAEESLDGYCFKISGLMRLHFPVQRG